MITDDRIIIISTHQVRDLQNLLDQLIVLDTGKIIFQESIASIMDRLSFSVVFREEDTVGSLYYERVPGGYYCVYPVQDDDSLEVDIEILFNALIANAGAFQKIFKLQHHE